MSNNRKRAIRALMAETGLRYTQAMRDLDRRRDAAERDQETAPAPESTP